MHDVLAIYEELMLVAREMLVIYGRLLIDIHGIHEQLYQLCKKYQLWMNTYPQYKIQTL